MGSKKIDTNDFYLQSSDVIQDYYDLADDTFIQTDSKLFILDCNLKFCELQNKTRQELIGKRVLNFFSNDSHEDLKKLVIETIENRISKLDYRLNMVVRNSKKIPFKLKFYPIKGSATGKITGWFFKLSVVDKEKDNNDQYETMFLTMYDSLNKVYTIINSDMDGKINHINSNLCAILGYEEKELVGKNVEMLYDVETQEGKSNYLRMMKQLTKEHNFVGEIILKSKENEHIPFFLTVSNLLHKGKVIGRLGVGRDLRKVKELEENNKTISTQLVNQSKLAEFGSMLQGVAHNLNTPLTGIKSSAQLQKAKLKKLYTLFAENVDSVDPKIEKLYESILKSVNLINAASDKLTKIINNMMAKARQQQSTATESLNIGEIMEQELEFMMTNMFFKHKVEKDFDVHKDLPIIHGLCSDFSQTFVNLIKNALDAMYNSEKKILEIKVYEENDNIIVRIKDSGYGIPADVREKIFNRYFTTKPKLSDAKKTNEPAGTGIGLDNVKSLMKPYKTKIKIASQVGVGTEFILTIPVKENQDEDLHNIDTKKLASILK